MNITNIDHIVLTVKDVNKTAQFYASVLGMVVEKFGEGRIALKFGNQKINLHEYGNEFEPKANQPTPGSEDLCFITDVKLEVAMNHVKSKNVQISCAARSSLCTNQTENIWIEYHEKLLLFIKSRVSDSFIAEDILHEVFIKIHAKLDMLDEPIKLRSWLYQITRNTIIDYYRTRKIETELPDWIVEPTQIDTEEIIRQELSSCLAPMINNLPEKYRLAIQLSEIEGKTQKEVAKQENISLSGAKSRVQRGRTMLKTMLHDCCQLEINKSKQIIDYSVKDKFCKFC